MDEKGVNMSELKHDLQPQLLEVMREFMEAHAQSPEPIRYLDEINLDRAIENMTKSAISALSSMIAEIPQEKTAAPVRQHSIAAESLEK